MIGTIYLDNAATSFPKPEVVRDAMSSFCRQSGVNPGRSGCDLGLRAEAMVYSTRRQLSEFFNQSLEKAGRPQNPNRLCFTPNATASLNLIVNGVLRQGDHVVTTVVEHNSVIRPVNHATRRGVEATYVDSDDEGYVDPEAVRSAIQGNTRLVIVIGLFAILNMGNSMVSNPKWLGLSTEAYIFISLFFFAVCFSISRYSALLEKRLDTAR